MSDVDDLVAAMVLGDPGETVPTDLVTAMARAVLAARWIPCPHTDFVTLSLNATLTTQSCGLRTCTRCGARLIVEPEDTDD